MTTTLTQSEIQALMWTIDHARLEHGYSRLVLPSGDAVELKGLKGRLVEMNG